MAGDWIKMRTSLLTNPKVNGIARIIEGSDEVGRVLTQHNSPLRNAVTRTVTRHVTVSSLLIVWGAANEHTKDGVFRNADLSDIDDMVAIPGFGEAMCQVGWAEYDPENRCVTLPNFTEYNTTGDERSAGAKTSAQRQKEYRERKKALRSENGDVTRDVTSDVTRNRREEKRREDIKEPPISPKGEKSARPKKPAVSLQSFLEDCKAKNERPLRDYQPLWDYVNGAGLETDFISLAWAEFSRRFLPSGTHETKRQADWRKTFRNYVENNYLKLWAADAEGRYFLTTAGKQASKFHENKAVA